MCKFIFGGGNFIGGISVRENHSAAELETDCWCREGKGKKALSFGSFKNLHQSKVYYLLDENKVIGDDYYFGWEIHVFYHPNSMENQRLSILSNYVGTKSNFSRNLIYWFPYSLVKIVL